MTDTSTLEAKTKEYMQHLAKLNATSEKIRKKIKSVTDRHIDELSSTLDEMKKLEAEIREETKANKHLFKKPKTRILNGIKIGFRKGKGSIVISDEENCIKKIKRYYKADIDTLIQQKESLLKSGLEQLDAKKLKKLGVTIKQAAYQVEFVVYVTDIDE